jgi:ATP-binding cassette, subfamily F, member 3
MFSAVSLTKSFGSQVIFNSISFTIGPGERIGLVGRNGSGKTTLFRLILKEEEPDSGTITIPRNYSIGYLSQTISFSQPTVLKEACLELPPTEDGIDQTYRAKSILFGLGFSEDDFHRDPLHLSSGYQIRLNLAKVLVSRPDLLLLDEPTNYLDIVSIRWLGQFLREWKSELMLITHDRAFMDSVTTHTIGIHRCTIRKIRGSTHKLYGQVLQDEEVYEKTRINDERRRKELEQFINRFRAQATRARAVQSRIRTLAKRESLEKLTELRNLDFQFPAAPFSGKWLMDVRDLSFSYDSGSPLFDGLTFSVKRRDRIGVVGKNGKGKTTLLNLLAGNLSDPNGTISRHPAAKMSYFGQAGIEGLNDNNTIEEEIMQAHPEYSRGTARNICGLMLFDGDKALKKVSVLSGGEKSRVLLGKLLVSPSNLLLLDEPTNHLDMESVDSLIEAIDAFNGAVIIATHSEMILHAMAERLIVFDGGAVSLFEGTYQDFLDRVGWGDEEVFAKPAPRKGNEKKQKIEKKELRRQRAEIITHRSRALGPLEENISRVEREITEREEQIQRDNEALIRASRAGGGSSIAALSLSIHESRKRIEDLFQELEELSGEHHVKANEYEERLSQLAQIEEPR